jgi:hypothetical protein
MGKRFLRTIVVDQQVVLPSSEIVPIDLPVNPLSFLVLTIYAETSTNLDITNSETMLNTHMELVTELSVRHRGETIIQGNLRDIAMLSYLITGTPPWGREFSADDNTIRARSFVIPFTRKPYDHNEAFPATQRGNLRFHMTTGAAPANSDNFWFSIESLELIEDNPTQFLKYTTLTRTLANTGRQRVQLPIGNEILALLLYDPANEVGAAEMYSFGKVKLMKDNVEQYYGTSNWEALAADLAMRVQNLSGAFGHTHHQAAVDTIVGGFGWTQGTFPPLQYGLLDFDPLKDGSYALETAGAASLDLDMDVDNAGPTARIIPVELIKIPGAGGA